MAPWSSIGQDTTASSSAPVSPEGDDMGGFTPDPKVQDLLTAHVVLMCAAFLLFFPVGALIVRLGANVMKFHLPMLVFALILSISGVGVGIPLANETNTSLGHTTHTVIGLVVVFGLLAFQPLMGWMQHLHFVKYRCRGVFGTMHIWYGRSLVLLGIVNGGIGFKLTMQMPSTAWRHKAYAAVAAFVGFCWILALAINIYRKRSIADLIGIMPKKKTSGITEHRPRDYDETTRVGSNSDSDTGPDTKIYG